MPEGHAQRRRACVGRWNRRTRAGRAQLSHRVALVGRGGASCQALEDSLQPGTPFPRSLPPRRWVASRSFFPSALSAGAGRMRKKCWGRRSGKASAVFPTRNAASRPRECGEAVVEHVALAAGGWERRLRLMVPPHIARNHIRAPPERVPFQRLCTATAPSLAVERPNATARPSSRLGDRTPRAPSPTALQTFAR